ncbi:nucleotide-diphospho-sugar transferase-domain-containing protein [Pavlovales sp. CCMP2436]|nr:nucleotide-diphospho-sugar transferase-domain-containing protein [Pavlovales sp. CCMP2436]
MRAQGRAGPRACGLLALACGLLLLQAVGLPARIGTPRVRVQPGHAPPNGTSVPPARASGRRSGSLENVLLTLPPAPHTVVLTFGTVAVLDFLLNWVQHVQRIPSLDPFVVAAIDHSVFDACAVLDVRVFLAPRWQIIANRTNTPQKQHKAASEYFRADLSSFKKMGFVKVLTVAALLEHGYSVLVSDVDVIWLRHPWGVLRAPGKLEHEAAPADGLLALEHAQALEEADLLLGTDNVDMALDASPHRLLEAEINTGVLFVRASDTALAFMHEWAQRCLHTRDGHDQQPHLAHLHSNSERAASGMSALPPDAGRRAASSAGSAGAAGAEGEASEYRDPAERDLRRCTPVPYVPTLLLPSPDAPADAPHVRVGGLAFVHWAPLPLARAEVGGKAEWPQPLPVGRARLGASLAALAAVRRRPVQWVWHGRLRAAVLPMSLFTGGHAFFVQHMHERAGAPLPISVHLSWGFGDLFGKRERLRELGWWLVEEAGYFDAGDFVRITGVAKLYDAAVAPYAVLADRCVPADPEPSACWHPTNLVDPHLAVGQRDPRAALDPAAPQLAAQAALRRMLRNAFALAEETGRVLVLPELRCYCERFWWLLADCRVAGAEHMPLPFRCPFDFLFEPYWWDELRVQRRHASFWHDPRVPAELLASTVRIRLGAGGADGDATGGGGSSRDSGGGALAVDARNGVGAVARALGASAAASLARVLELDALELAQLSGCVRMADAQRGAFNGRMLKLLGGFSVEYCSRERNLFLAEEAPYYTSRKRDAKEAMNCSYPGADPVVANPVTWPRLISEDNRRRWYGGDLQVC